MGVTLGLTQGVKMVSKVVKVCELECLDIVEALDEPTKVDVGSGVFVTGTHPVYGRCTVFSNSTGDCALIK